MKNTIGLFIIFYFLNAGSCEPDGHSTITAVNKSPDSVIFALLWKYSSDTSLLLLEGKNISPNSSFNWKIRGSYEDEITEKNPFEFFVVNPHKYNPTGLIAIRDNTTDYFVMKDHASAWLSTGLGSTRVAFNGTTGAVVAYFDYSPFGKTARSFESGTIVKYTYTGQEKDPETGLMNYKARMYDPNIGRFYAG